MSVRARAFVRSCMRECVRARVCLCVCCFVIFVCLLLLAILMNREKSMCQLQKFRTYRKVYFVWCPAECFHR